VQNYASFKIYLESLACSLLCRCKDYNLQKRNFDSCLYGCVTWSQISKEQRRLMVFVNEVQGKILGEIRMEQSVHTNFCFPNPFSESENLQYL
jgi:hypothetical protein